MSERSIDPAYLRYQYGTAEKLNIRIASHERYSERAQDFRAWVLQRLDLAPGLTVLDVGCGSGAFHRDLGRHGTRIIGCDRSPGMVQEVLAQAAQYRLPVGACQAEAEALPFAAGSCDRVMANHMLYHVPDQEQALRELRRVLKPGGRVVMATNAADHGRRFRVLHDEVAGELGYTPTGNLAGRFTLNDLPLVQRVFADAERHVVRSAFVFPTAEAALAYYASGLVDGIAERDADGSHRGKLLPIMAARIEAIIEREGVFRVPKDAGCFVASV